VETPHGLLLVEGQDDKHVLENLLAHHGVADFKVDDRGGCENLLKDLPVLLKSSERKHIGIVLDADTDLSRRWLQTRSILQKAGYRTLPASPARGGTLIAEAGKPNIGIWLMPDNSALGMLEDFVAQLIPDDDACWPVAIQAVDNLPPEHRRFRDVDVPKARMHTWLAWQETPGVRMGAAITRKYLDPNSESADAFVTWVRRIIAGPANS